MTPAKNLKEYNEALKYKWKIYLDQTISNFWRRTKKSNNQFGFITCEKE
jgi:hypothetical protein